MKKTTKSIVFKVIQGDKLLEVSTFSAEYRNLMDLLYDKFFLDDFGECKGMGRCGTCLIEILSSEKRLADLERNESTTLLKSGITHPNVRLACQLLVDESLHESTIKIHE